MNKELPTELQKEIDADFRRGLLEYAFLFSCDADLERLREFTGTMEDYIEANKMSRDLELSTAINRLTKLQGFAATREETESWDWYHLEELPETFPQLLRQSVIISLQSLVQRQMKKACELLSFFVDHSLTVRDIQGKGIRQSRTYLQKLCGVDFDTLNNTWITVSSISDLRHIFVHGLNDLNSAKVLDKNLPDFPEYSSIKFEKSGSSEHPSTRIILEKDFAFEMIMVSSDFFTQLLSSCVARCKELGKSIWAMDSA